MYVGNNTIKTIWKHPSMKPQEAGKWNTRCTLTKTNILKSLNIILIVMFVRFHSLEEYVLVYKSLLNI